MNSEDERDLDRDLTELFKSAGPLEPSRDFVERTIIAARSVSLSEGRRALSHRPRTVWWLLGSAAIVGFALVVFMSAGSFVAPAIALVFRGGIRAGFWLARGLELWLAFTSVSSTVGLAFARAMATTEGLSVLVGTSLVSALALSALYRLLSDDGEKSQWQEL